MSRTGDSPPQGPQDGDAFSVFAAIAPFARRILEIDPDFLVDQAAELDDDFSRRYQGKEEEASRRT